MVEYLLCKLEALSSNPSPTTHTKYKLEEIIGVDVK
jgi:hypothetical protein